MIFSTVRTEIRIHGGGMTDDSLKINYVWGVIGSNYDFIFNEILILSPEFFFIVPDFSFRNIYLTPGITINVKIDDLFAGGGIVKLFPTAGPQEESLIKTDNIKLKLNLGIRSPRIIFTIFGLMEFNGIFKNMDVGFTLGITI